MSTFEMIDVVCESGRKIDTRSRSEVHRLGLLHREVQVFLYTPAREIIFQERSQTSEMWGGYLDATVNGHVLSGSNKEEAVVRETKEEAGLELEIDGFIHLKDLKRKLIDPVSDITNNSILSVYTTRLPVIATELIPGSGKVESFSVYSLESLESLDQASRGAFVPSMLTFENMNIYEQIVKFLPRF